MPTQADFELAAHATELERLAIQCYSPALPGRLLEYVRTYMRSAPPDLEALGWALLNALGCSDDNDMVQFAVPGEAGRRITYAALALRDGLNETRSPGSTVRAGHVAPKANPSAKAAQRVPKRRRATAKRPRR